MPVKSFYFVLCAIPVLLGGACKPPAEIRHRYGDAEIGRVILVGYLRSSAELTLYESSRDATNHGFNKCINGIVSTMGSANTILYDNKLVKITGVLKEYYLPADDIEAIQVKIKNNCNSPKFFVATNISVAGENAGQLPTPDSDQPRR